MAEPDQPDSESVTPPASESVTPQASPVRPVRSAPLRRGAKKRPPVPTARPGERDSTDSPDTAEAPDAADATDATDATDVAGVLETTDAPESDNAEEDKAEPGKAEPDKAEPDKAEEDTAEEADGAGAEPTAAQPGAVEPEPSEVERSLGYRERRRGRTRPSPPAGASAPVAFRGRRIAPVRAIVVASAVAVIVACTVVAVVAGLGIERQSTKDRLRAEYSDFASQVIVNLTSFSPKTTDNALRTLERQTSGRAKTQISESIEQVTSLVKSTNVETRTTVLSSAVTKATDDEGSVIMVYGWEQRSLDGKTEPEYQTFRWRVDVTRINGELKMTNFEWVT